MIWLSTIEDLGEIRFPKFGQTRILMMPFKLDDIYNSLPSYLDIWKGLISISKDKSPCKDGVAYLTID